MKVHELITELQKLDQDKEIIFQDNDPYDTTYFFSFDIEEHSLVGNYLFIFRKFNQDFSENEKR